MPAPHAELRKAAILLQCLDAAAAERLLRHVDAHQAEAIRATSRELSEIDPAEQKEIIDEFMRGKDAVPPATLVGHTEPPSRAPESFDHGASRNGKEALPPTAEMPFGFLMQAPSEEVTQYLWNEHPQTIAVVVSHLSPTKAVEVLAALPCDVQAEVIRRLVDLDAAHPEMIREVERGLQTMMSLERRADHRREAGVAAVGRLLRASDARTQQGILANLARVDRPLAELLGRREPRFEHLESLDAELLMTIFASAPSEVARLALAGGSPVLVARVLGRFPPREAQRLMQQIEQLGPTRLSDVERAQQEIVRLAESMELLDHRVFSREEDATDPTRRPVERV